MPPTVTKRIHARRACDSCKTRKRKCDGKKPCSYCTLHDFECTYQSVDHRRRPSQYSRDSQVRQGSTPHSILAAQNSRSPRGPAGIHSQEDIDANAGVSFLQTLSKKLRATSTASEGQGFAWNLGIRTQIDLVEPHQTITQIITHSQWQASFDVYVQNIHPFYGFLDLEVTLAQASVRWDHPPFGCTYDHILCGTAALASLFSGVLTVTEGRALFHCARELLTSGMSNEPTFEDAQAWLLRTLYLRCTDTPHASWMASCTTMHVVEAVGIRWRSESLSRSTTTWTETDITLSCKKKAFWLARLLNTWISWEYGRSHVTIRQAVYHSLDETDSDQHTCQLIELFKLSQVLEPSEDGDTETLENALSDLASYDLTEIPLILSQSTLSFALYRRLRLGPPEVSPKLLEHVISLGRKGLQASLNAVRSNLPWWHVPNVPFQFVCVLIAMDTSESLSCIREALLTLREVTQHFNTPLMSKSLKAAEALVELYKKRKQHAVEMLQDALDVQSGVEQVTELDFDSALHPPEDITAAADMDTAWLNNLLFNFPSLNFPSFDNSDWSQY